MRASGIKIRGNTKQLFTLAETHHYLTTIVWNISDSKSSVSPFS